MNKAELNRSIEQAATTAQAPAPEAQAPHEQAAPAPFGPWRLAWLVMVMVPRRPFVPRHEVTL